MARNIDKTLSLCYGDPTSTIIHDIVGAKDRIGRVREKSENRGNKNLLRGYSQN